MSTEVVKVWFFLVFKFVKMRVCFLSDFFSVVLGTFLLLLCSIVCNLSYHLWKLGFFGFFVLCVKVSLFFLLAFVSFQYFEYSSGTFHIISSSFGSIFYTLTGLHGLHVIIGFILLLRLLPSTLRYLCTNYVAVQLKLTYLYIHVVDAVWVVLVVFIYMPIWNY